MNNCCCGNQHPLTLKIKQGESKAFVFTLIKNNAPVDLTGAEILLQVRESMTDVGDYVIEKTVTTNSDGDVDGKINNPENGEFYLKINDTDIEEMETTKPYYCAIYKINGDTKICISAPAFQTALFLVLNP